MRRANEWTQQKFREYGTDRTDSRELEVRRQLDARPDDAAHARAAAARAARRVVGVVAGHERPTRRRRRVSSTRAPKEFNRRFAGKLARQVGDDRRSRIRTRIPTDRPVTHADSARLDSARAELRAADRRRARFMPNRSVSCGAREGGRRDPRRRQGVRAAHDERLAGRDLALSADRDLATRSTRSSSGSLSAASACSIEADIKNTFGRDDVAPGEHASPRFAAAKSRTKSCCSARISIRGISRRAAPTTEPARSPCSRRRAFSRRPA